MGYKKLLMNIILGGVCLISFSLAKTAPELPKIPNDSDDANDASPELIIPESGPLIPPEIVGDYAGDDYSDDPLSTKEKVLLFEIEFRRERCSLRNLSIDTRSILNHEARLVLLKKDFKNKAISAGSLPAGSRSFEEKLTFLENAVVHWLSSYWNLKLNVRLTLEEMGFLRENSQRPLSLEERAALSIDDRLTILDAEAGHDKRSPRHARREIIVYGYGDHSLDIQAFDALNEIDEAFQAIKRLINVEGLGVNFRYDEGSPLLHFAAEVRCGLEIVRFLLDHGADINALDADGYNALRYAIHRGNIATVQLLIKRGIDTRIIVDGQTMLHLAMTTLLDPSPEIVQLLIAVGVDCNVRNNNGKTPLDLAIEKKEETSDEEAKKKWDAIINILQSHAI
ncbi:MAG: ankyrin repeat domain-containing protein [Puniceicoccales bacterium]|jgi:hypothetical protein|nr:ankyrin repeat domain-containing protein [Puniceicoccales bacterium]